MWINVQFYDETMTLVSESGAYDTNTGVLSHDEEVKIYEIEPGLDEVTAPLVGVDPGPSLHFVLNNKIFHDNRIPPRGFNNAAFADFGGSPEGYSYEDGQYWDETYYTIPPEARSVEVTLYYQSTSKEFVEFLRDENFTNSVGQDMYDLWNNNGKCPPEMMAQAQLTLTVPPPDADQDEDYDVDIIDLYLFSLQWMNTGCGGGGCGRADLHVDILDRVNLKDFAVFANEWYYGL